MKMEQTECSEMSVYKIQTPGNYPEENIQQPLIIFPVSDFMTIRSATLELSVEDWYVYLQIWRS